MDQMKQALLASGAVSQKYLDDLAAKKEIEKTALTLLRAAFGMAERADGVQALWPRWALKPLTEGSLGLPGPQAVKDALKHIERHLMKDGMPLRKLWDASFSVQWDFVKYAVQKSTSLGEMVHLVAERFNEMAPCD